MECEGIPGLALTIIRDGQDFLSKGYGVQDIDTLKPVTNETLFVINSVTKNFAGVVTAMNVKELESLELTTPLRNVFGEDFFLNDSVRTQHLTVVDALAHRSGLADHNAMRMSGFTPMELLQRLQYLEYSSDFRHQYQYNSVMYGLVSALTEIISGLNWTQYVADNLFEPLEMQYSRFVLDPTSWPYIAQGYQFESNGDLRPVHLKALRENYYPMPASGSIATNALDMRKWIKFRLREGTTEGGTILLTPEEFATTYSSWSTDSFTRTIRRPLYPVTHLAGGEYGLGLNIGTYRDYYVHYHVGGLASFNSKLVILPDVNHGIFVTMNTNPSKNARDVITMFIMDLLLGEEPWLTADTICDFITLPNQTFYGDDYLSTLSKEPTQFNEGWLSLNLMENFVDLAEAVMNEDKMLETKPIQSEIFQQIEGSYGHYGYGNLTITSGEENGKYIMVYGLGGYNWTLEQSLDDENLFIASGTEPFWYLDYILLFARDDNDIATTVTVSFDSEIPPRFDRDLDWNNPPPPPTLC